jgi:hypothetical protein
MIFGSSAARWQIARQTELVWPTIDGEAALPRRLKGKPRQLQAATGDL